MKILVARNFLGVHVSVSSKHEYDDKRLLK